MDHMEYNGLGVQMTQRGETAEEIGERRRTENGKKYRRRTPRARIPPRR